MRWLQIQIIVCVLPIVTSQTPFVIGGAFEYENDRIVFEDAVREINQNKNHVLPRGITLSSVSTILTDNPLNATMELCQKVVPNQVAALIMCLSKPNRLSAMSVSNILGSLEIPVVDIATRSNLFNDRNIHNTYMRTVPAYTDQAEVWLDLIGHYRWTNVVTVTSKDDGGSSMLNAFIRLVNDSSRLGIKIEKAVQFNKGQTNMTGVLLQVKKAQSTVVLLHASANDEVAIYSAAKELGLTAPGFIWITDEQGINARALRSIPDGTLAMRLPKGTNRTAHINDAIMLLVKGLHELVQNDNVTRPPSTCGDAPWRSGHLYYRWLKDTKLSEMQAETGAISFSGRGDRISNDYDIVNLQNGDLKIVGKWTKTSKVMMNAQVIWPGRKMTKPEGYRLSTHLQVVTIKSIPFVYTDKPHPTNGCVDEHYLVCTDGKTGEIMCCKGFCIDLLANLSNFLNFTFDLHIVADGHYGDLVRVTNSTERRWNGMIGELLDGKADIIMAPLTINKERVKHIDFSKPFKYQGLTILVKKDVPTNKLVSFLRPFETELWILMFLAIHVVAFFLFILDRLSPFSRMHTGKFGREQDALNLSRALWFSWGVLFNSGIGEGTPRSLSARVVGMVWAFFSMIMLASYTANLAAFLVLDKPEGKISGINDARMRNPSNTFKFATVKGSSVDAYFRRQVELSTMYTFMETFNYVNADAAVEAVREGELDAFIWDSAMLDYQTSRDCNLVTVGELFGKSGFGIGLPKESLWTQEVSLAILHFQEGGVMERLESEWISYRNCPVVGNQPATLSLENMGERQYKAYHDKKEHQKELAGRVTLKWKAQVKKRQAAAEERRQKQTPSESGSEEEEIALLEMEMDAVNGRCTGRIDKFDYNSKSNNHIPVPTDTPV
ncbi:glutamate receptor ionotropic, NMDA 1-like isoform X2 [Anneissia japonica]|uniref:glutamate receptor ionotropic, NMDA 1-like isoform X2 n=1 Tax=Anneissia japonica TaxID=1529436 RepID=UPI0014259EE4|nr:glutamate receptor ionotropic, NMDA 1-like isoform X2 [Anneissia japonica]